MRRNPAAQRADLALEQALWGQGYRAVAGVDEAGRGAWAGPVVAAAVILPTSAAALAGLLGRVDDSKRVVPRQRELLCDLITARALAVGVGWADAGEIDRTGIVAATLSAMAAALAALQTAPDFVLVDFMHIPGLLQPQRGVPHGDALSLSIAAASIVAKVTRDRWMAGQDAAHPGYGFAAHKGYGTAGHQATLAGSGPCPLHRLTFRPVAARAGGPFDVRPAYDGQEHDERT